MDTGEDIDVENLFNEDDLAQAALVQEDILADQTILPHGTQYQPPLVPAVSSFLTDLANNGCVRPIAWSRTGILVYVGDDGSTLFASIQRLDPRTGKWIVSPPKPLDGIFDDVLNLTWSFNQNELAILTRHGQVQIYTLHGPHINKLVKTRDGQEILNDESQEPIGVLWLGMSRNEKEKKKTILENVKEDGKWRQEHIEGQPYPPHQIRALCFVSHTGLFTMLSTRDASPMVATTIQLAESDTYFSHAAIAQTPSGRLIVALHNSHDSIISTYYVDIQLEERLPPVLTVEIIDHDIPGRPPYANGGMAGATDELAEGSLLTQLSLLPECEYSWDHLAKSHLKPKQPTTLFAVYSAYSDQRNILTQPFLGTTLVKRWHFIETDYPMYSRLATSATNTTGIKATRIEPQPDSVMHSPITNLQTIEPGNIIATTSTDGSTAFWDSTSLQLVVPDAEHSIISSVGEMNLDYPHLHSTVSQCLSSHGLCIAHLDHQSKLQISTPKYRDYTLADLSTQKLHDLDPSIPTDDALIAGYILAFSRSCWTSSATFDDITSSIMSTISVSSLVHIRRQLFTSLFKLQNLVPGPSSSGSEVEKVPHSLITNKALCFQLVLFNRASPMSQSDRTAFLWTWLVVNARWSIQVLGDTYKTIQPQQNARSQFAPSFLDLLCHNIRWIFSVYNYIFQALFEISDRATHPEFFEPRDPNDITGDGKQGLIALLLNQSWSRIFLTIMARLLKACASKANVSINFNASSPLQTEVHASLNGTTLGRIAKTIESCCLQHGLTVNAIEAIFDNKHHPDTWVEGGDNFACFTRQIDMMVSGTVQPEYEGTVSNIIEALNGQGGLRAKGEVDRLRLSEEMPNLSYVLLNMDDIGFERHRVKMCFDAYETVNRNGGSTQKKRKINGHDTKKERVLYDVHKKVPVYSYQSLAVNPLGSGMAGNALRVANVTGLLEANIRRCVRCGSLSDSLLEATRMNPGGWSRQLLGVLNRCVCEGSWMAETIGEGLNLN